MVEDKEQWKMLTRQHFEVVAGILGRCNATMDMVVEFIRYFDSDNPNFDPDKFLRAVAKARGI